LAKGVIQWLLEDDRISRKIKMTILVPSDSAHEQIASQCQELAALITRHLEDQGDGFYQTRIDKLQFARESCVASTLAAVSTPMLAIVVQGKKAALLGEETYYYGAAQYLILSVDLPISGFITEATLAQPYLGFRLDLDSRQLGEIITAQPSIIASKKETSVRGFFVSTAETPLLDCALRLTKLLDTPQDIPMLAPMITQEIYYRLLMGEQCEAVRQIATSGSNMQRIAQVIQHIKTDFTQPLRIENLADRANMSPSSFHYHFKQVTSMSPLQYQKQLRLLEARRLMLVEKSTAANAANLVGYESPSQFSREYSRMFGAPPIQDVVGLAKS
jgi:AraC-like DNA-binding protein